MYRLLRRVHLKGLLSWQAQADSLAGTQKAKSLVWVKLFKPDWYWSQPGFVILDDAADLLFKLTVWWAHKQL